MFIARLETKTKPYSSTCCMTENVMEILDERQFTYSDK